MYWWTNLAGVNYGTKCLGQKAESIVSVEVPKTCENIQDYSETYCSREGSHEPEYATEYK